MPLYNYNIEPALEDALISLFGAAGVAARGSMTTDELSTPRADVEFTLGQEREAGAPANPGVNYVWDGQFSVTITTDRDRNRASHFEFRATARQVIAETSRQDWESALGATVRLLVLTHRGTSSVVKDDDNGIDVSTMVYDATIALVPV